MIMLLPSDIESYDLAGLNLKIPDKPLSSHIFGKEIWPT